MPTLSMGSGTKYLALENFLMDKTGNITLTFIEINEITTPGDGMKFCGLPVDEDSEGELTEERVKNWCTQIKSEMGL